jgi:antirestriction protein ArdC
MQAESILSHHSSVYSIVTAKIIEQLETGVAPWRKPWRAEAPCNLVTGKPYRGINPFLLAPQGYGSRYWLTFNQASRLGGHVRKGEKSSLVTFWNIGQEKIATSADGVQRKSKPILLRYYNVFNVEQTDGIADKLGLGNSGPRVADLDACERIVANMPNKPTMAQHMQASYRPSTDTVAMPSKTAFDSIENYYSTLFHELTHSTGHQSRVGREGIQHVESFGSESYSREELIAELGAAMLCGITGIIPATLTNSASYLQSWIKVLKGDSKLIVSALPLHRRPPIISKGARYERPHFRIRSSLK